MLKKIVFISALLFTSGLAAQTCNGLSPSSPDSRFSVSGDEVTDKKTGLIWQQCSLGLSGTGCLAGTATKYNWEQALSAAEAERTANPGKLWRVPNIKELRSIVEITCSDPALNETAFPNTASDYYQSASSYAAVGSTSAWRVNFYGGSTSNSTKASSYSVRLVR